MKARSLRGGGNLPGLFDHVIRVWRRLSTPGALREEQRTYVVALEPAGLNGTVRRPTTRVGNAGPGETPIGEMRVYMAADIDVRPLDVLELVEGPSAPATVEVDATPLRPRGHHTELDCRRWTGKLPELGS